MEKTIHYILIAISLILFGFTAFFTGKILVNLEQADRAFARFEQAITQAANTKVDNLVAAINRGELLQLLVTQQAQIQSQAQAQPKK